MIENKDKKFSIKKVIVSTIAFFDMFDYPLSAWEIWKYGYWQEKNVGLLDVINELEELVASDVIEMIEAYYCLPKRETIIKNRKQKYNYYMRKYKRLKLVSRIFSCLPFVRMVAMTNAMGKGNLKDASDIDIFILSTKKSVWTTRLFCAGLMKLFGMRPSEGQEKDKICLSFYLSMEDLDLSRFMLGENDIYFVFWLAFMTPVNGYKNYRQLISANKWIFGFLPNWFEDAPVLGIKERDSVQRPSTLPRLIEGVAGKLQYKRLPISLSSIKNKDTRVVITDSVLKLHSKDRREYYFNLWKKKIADIKL